MFESFGTVRGKYLRNLSAQSQQSLVMLINNIWVRRCIALCFWQGKTF